MRYRRTPISPFDIDTDVDVSHRPTNLIALVRNRLSFKGSLDRLDIVFCLEDQEGLVRNHRGLRGDSKSSLWADPLRFLRYAELDKIKVVDLG
jgi:hypothetical protein